MPQSPDPNILDAAAAKRAASDLIETACPLLRELVNIGTNVGAIAFESDKQEEESAFPLLSSFLHILEMADGLEVLFRESCAWAGVPLCRSMFESLVTFEYIAAEDANQRASCWWVANSHANLEKLERMDSRTARGQDFLEQVRHDKTLGGWGEMSNSKIDLHRVSTAAFLARDEHRAAESEYQRLSRTKRWEGKLVPWHALFGGPTNMRDLARAVQRGAQYELMYREWSEIVHPQNLTRWIYFPERHAPMVKRIRDTKVFSHLAFCGANMILEANAALLDWFAPDRMQAAALDSTYVGLYERLKSQPM